MPATTETTTDTYREQIRQFEQAYDYDCSYLYDLLDRTPAGFARFHAARPMTSFREHLPAEAYYVAAITVMQHKDCGTCLQLNLQMAQEEGVDPELLRTLLEFPERLPAPLQDVRRHAALVTADQEPDPECAARIRACYGEAAFGELALCIAGVQIYPTLKRALLKASSCRIPVVGVPA